MKSLTPRVMFDYNFGLIFTKRIDIYIYMQIVCESYIISTNQLIAKLIFYFNGIFFNKREAQNTEKISSVLYYRCSSSVWVDHNCIGRRMFDRSDCLPNKIWHIFRQNNEENRIKIVWMCTKHMPNTLLWMYYQSFSEHLLLYKRSETIVRAFEDWKTKSYI